MCCVVLCLIDNDYVVGLCCLWVVFMRWVYVFLNVMCVLILFLVCNIVWVMVYVFVIFLVYMMVFVLLFECMVSVYVFFGFGCLLLLVCLVICVIMFVGSGKNCLCCGFCMWVLSLVCILVSECLDRVWKYIV